jgi:hypothetical protein
MGWLIDPEEELVFAYFADPPIATFEISSDRLPIPPFAASFRVGQLFGWLAE